jgi:hypothetical protein
MHLQIVEPELLQMRQISLFIGEVPLRGGREQADGCP